MESKGVAITSFGLRGDMNMAISFAVCPAGALHGFRNTPTVVMMDSLTACCFFVHDLVQMFGGLDQWGIDLLKATCGWTLTRDDWDELMKRATIIERCYSLREGHVPARDDMLPDRFFDETIYTKYGEPRSLDRQLFLEERQKWYLSNGLDKNGIPPKEYLEKLGLAFAIPTADKVRALNLRSVF